MRGVRKLLLVAVLALLLAAGLAACGGDGSDDSTAGSVTGRTEQTAPAGAPEDGGSADTEPADRAGGSGSQPEGSASFRTPGGDNSIQDFGEEGEAAEREAASAVVLAFMQAREAGDWDAVCLQLSAATRAQLDQLAERSSQLRGKDCADVLGTLVGNAPASTRVSTIGGGIDSLRSDGESGFALYRGTDGADYYLPLAKEGESWRVGALGPSEFP